jgi:hypothetical protein
MELVIEPLDYESSQAEQRPWILECQELDERRFLASTDDKSLAEWLLAVAAGAGPPDQRIAKVDPLKLPKGNAVLVVGHQPHLGWLSHELLRRGRFWRSRSFAVPFGRAELICLVFRKPHSLRRRWYGRGRVLWTLAPDDKVAAEEIRAKIKSKMDTAKTLSSVITFGLGALLGLLLDSTKWNDVGWKSAIQIAAGLLFVSLVLYLASMYSYDRLLMPDRFWGERRPRRNRLFDRGRGWLLQRPPSSAAWVLYVNMMRVWYRLFTPATVCVVAALMAFATAALHLEAWQIFYIALPVAAFVAALVYWFRPVLGSDD